VRTESTAIDRALFGVALVVSTTGGVVWVGAMAAARIAGGQLHATVADALGAAVRLPGNLGEPAAAWPSEQAAALPGPIPYWICTGLVAAVAVAVGVAALRLWQRVWRAGTDARSRLGVDTRAWMARARDLRTLFVKGPVPGRFIIGRFGRHLVATECRTTATPSRRPAVRRRQGDTGAVALVGPSRSGKTVAAVAGILEWEGPAILSSVKTDLLSSTIGWRATKGEVKVYDSLGLTPCAGVGWSPLVQADTMSGARRSARSLLEAVADDGTENLGMWKALAEYLMAGLFWVAANSGRDMATVVEWTLTQDRLRPDAPSEFDAIVEELLTHSDPRVAREALVALHALLSVWEQDERPRSSIYVTAQVGVAATIRSAINARVRRGAAS
jgi:type IV secretion system protein VirD4